MFDAVARLESVSGAAAEIGRSQPAVTQTIAKLERQLGVDLVERRRSGSYLTTFGRVLHLRTRRLFGMIEQALADPLVGAPLVDRARMRPVAARLTSNHANALIAMRRSVRELEQIIDRRVTRHGAQGLNLTPAGVELARQIRLAMKEMEYAQEEISAAHGVDHSTISIGAIPQCATTVLTAAIDTFARHVPSAIVKVDSGPYNPLLSDLRQGKIDFLFGVLRKPDWVTDVEEHPMFEAPYSIVARKSHPLARKLTPSLDDLAAYDWLLPQPGTPRHQAFHRMFENARRKPDANIETNRSDILEALLELSDRITMMSTHEARRLATKGSITILDYHPPMAPRFDGVATRTGWHPTPTGHRFLEILREQASTQFPAAQGRSTAQK
jgi:DNA-binding transcriptional LysR family regulator